MIVLHLISSLSKGTRITLWSVDTAKQFAEEELSTVVAEFTQRHALISLVVMHDRCYSLVLPKCFS